MRVYTQPPPGDTMHPTPENDVDWGFLAEPVHQDVAPGGPAWRDNAWIAFWDGPSKLFGVLHMSTSPNAGGRRARCSVVIDGHYGEIEETLEPGTFQSESIDFQLDGRVTVKGPELELALTAQPRFVVGDYSASGVIPALDGAPRLQHYQQGANIDVAVAVRDHEVTTQCLGFRDRTWGPRDESVQFVEWLGVEGCFADYDLTAIKFRSATGEISTHGFLLREDEAKSIQELTTTRAPSGSLNGLTFSADGQPPTTLNLHDARGGFALPFGDGGPPPSTVAYDQCVDYEVDGTIIGSGIAEQGAVHVL